MKPVYIIVALIAVFVVMIFTMKESKHDNHSAERMKKVRLAKKRKAQARAEMARSEMKLAS